MDGLFQRNEFDHAVLGAWADIPWHDVYSGTDSQPDISQVDGAFNSDAEARAVARLANIQQQLPDSKMAGVWYGVARVADRRDGWGKLSLTVSTPGPVDVSPRNSNETGTKDGPSEHGESRDSDVTLRDELWGGNVLTTS